MKWVHLPRLQIQNANAHSAYWIVNATPIMACVLFAHALSRRLGAVKYEHGVAVVHHDAQMLAEEGEYKRWMPNQRRGAVFINKTDYSSKNPHALSLQPTTSCHLCLSLAIAYDDDADLDESIVEQFLHGGRLAGGVIVDYKKPPKSALIRREAPDFHEGFPRGFVLVERQDLMKQRQPHEDYLDVLLRQIYVPKPEEDRESWIVPTTLGYAAVSPIAHRNGSREGYEHAFGEPLVGLVQYQSPKLWLDRALPLWRWHWPQNDIFLISQLCQ